MRFQYRGPELMGALTWLGNVKEYMKARLKHFPELLKFSDNMRVLEGLHREYMSLLATGYKKADIVSGSGDFVKWDRQTYTMSRIMADRLNVPQLLVLNYFLAVYNLARAGKIPFQKWNPKEYEKSKELQKQFPTEKDFFEKTGEKAAKFTKMLIPLTVGAGIITVLVLFRKKG